MRNSTRLLISLSMAALPAFAIASKPVMAQKQLGPTQAIAHLATAHAVAEKCYHLTQDRLEELGSYLHAAEVVVANQVSRDDLVRLMNKSKAKGNAMECGDESATLAFDALGAARAAMHQANQQDFQRAAYADLNENGNLQQSSLRPSIDEEQQSAHLAEPLEVEDEDIEAARLDEPAEQTPKAREDESAPDHPASDLNHYVLTTAAYYVERRCGHLAHAQAVRFWQGIVAQHNHALSRHAQSKVAKAKAKAISIANHSGGCGAKTHRIVKSGLSMVR